jgi:hypothetical protein
MDQPTRFPWNDFPDVLIHASESFVKQHPLYAVAKSGDTAAATELVFDALSADVLDRIWALFSNSQPRLVSAHAEEASGVNAIPEAMASAISDRLNWRLEPAIIQANTVNHTGAGGYDRLQRQAIFSGFVGLGLDYVLVDDFIGQGGTLANLRGHIMSQGGHVLGATVLTGKSYSAKLASNDLQIAALRRQHGHIEDWWRQRFGFGFECLTASEARYLSRTATSERIIEGLEAVGG